MAITLAFVAVTNLLLAAYQTRGWDHEWLDWHMYLEAARRITEGNLYEETGLYRFPYSPLLAQFFGLMAPIGLVGWRALHFVAALALPTWPLRILTLASWPFWSDVVFANTTVFVFLAASWAIRGSRFGGLSFIALTLLIPRPIMLPVLVWLLWRHRELLMPSVFMLVAHSTYVLWTGLGPEWVALLVGGANEMAQLHNLSPSRFLGSAWLLIGMPLAGWLTLRGRLGWASLAVSPYLLPQYLLMGFLELAGPARRSLKATIPPAITHHLPSAEAAKRLTSRSARAIE